MLKQNKERVTNIKTAQKNMETMRATANNVGISNFAQQKKEAGSVNQVESRKGRKLNLVIKILLWTVIFVLPLFFVPNTPSVLELNKQILLVGLVGVAFLVWVGSMAVKSQIKFRANFIFVPIFVFLLVMGISTIFADYSTQSMWGFFGGEGRAFITLVFFVAFFVLFVNIIKSRKDIVTTLYVALVSGFLVVIFGLLQLWGKYILPIDGTHTPYFNSIGSVYLFGVYVSALFMLALNMLIYTKKTVSKIILGVLTLIFFTTLIIVSLKIIWIAIIIVLALVLGRLTIGGKNTGSSVNNILPMIFLVLALLMVLQKQPLTKKQLPVEVLLTHKSSANIAWNAIKNDFLLGSGPSNYINVYREFRPTQLGNFWSTNFNTSSSYLLTLASTVGILGTLAFLVLIIMGGVYLFRGIFANDDQTAILGVGIGSIWILLTLGLLFYVVNITILFMWWFVLALLVSTLAFSPKTELREFSTGSNSEKPSLLFSFVFVLVIIGIIVALYAQGQKYVAAIHFNKALIADAKGEDISIVVQEIDAAVRMDVNKDLYYRNRSLAFFAMANKRIADKGDKFAAEDAAYVSELIKRSLGDADKSKTINPNDVDNYMALVRVYESLLPTMEGSGEKALEFAENAVKVDPNNPGIYQRLASIYVTMSDLETVKNQAASKGELTEKAKEYLASAKNNINKAIELKPDFLAARLLLVGIFDRKGSNEEAINAMIESRKTFPRRPNLAFQLGLMYLRGDKLDEAGGQFVQAVQLDSNYANAHYFLGLVLDKKDKKEMAIKEFEKVLKLNEGNELVKSILENLKEGKSALEGLQQQSKIRNADDSEGVEESAQPSIDPEIDESQTIPEAATQEIEDEGNVKDTVIDNSNEEENGSSL
jgi:tetratricopeptide (TPR) repeat protein